MKTFEGTLDLRRHPIDPEHYHTVAKATAEALADEIQQRLDAHGNWSLGELGVIRYAVQSTLTEWFTGKFTPGGPTDPPDGAPTQKEQTGGPPPLE